MKLDYFFNPRSIAVIGASRDPTSVGQGVLKNLKKGGFFPCKYNKPFKGKLYAVNPKAKTILGVKSYPSIKLIKEDIEIAVICVPAKVVPLVAKECAEKKVKAVIIISAGFAEFNKAGLILQQEVSSVLKKAGIPFIGPNCLGVIRPSSNLNATFAGVMPPEGGVAFVTQSGALADSVIDWSVEAGYGFSAIVSIGNQADVTIPQLMEWLEHDKKTKSIALYIENLADGRKFMDVAKKMKKPVVVLKAGKTESGIKAVSSHTGNLAGSYDVYKAAFKQCNVIEANGIEDLFDFAKVLGEQPRCMANSVAIITNGGGCGVICADHCASFGVNLVELKDFTIRKLDSTGVMHPAYSRKNPLDIIGDALPERYGAAINVLLAEDSINGLIVIETLQTMTKPVENAKTIISARKKFPHKPIVCAFLGGKYTKPGIEFLKKHNIPIYDSVEKAAKAIYVLIQKK